MTGSAERIVAEMVVALRAKGHSIPRSIGEIPDFPCRTWSELLEAWELDRLLLQRFSAHFDSNLFGMFATRGERLQLPFYSMGIYVIPVASVALAFIQSWWWLIGVAFPVIGFKRTKSLYNGAIYRAAFSSETIFCYLYFLRQVNLATPDFQNIYYWGAEKKEERDKAAAPNLISRKSPIVEEFEKEISTWPPEQAVIALQLLEATLSGDGDAIERLHQELTVQQFRTVTNVLRRMEAEIEARS